MLPQRWIYAAEEHRASICNVRGQVKVDSDMTNVRIWLGYTGKKGGQSQPEEGKSW
jgi:hypothetical protein